MAEPILHVQGLVKRFGGVLANDGVDIAVAAGELHAVIGPNGAGKSTLIALIAGEILPDRGTIRLGATEVTRLPQHRRVALGLARSFQVTSVLAGFSVEDNVSIAVQALSGHSFGLWRPASSLADFRARTAEVLERVGLTRRAPVPAGALAHGEKRQLEVAMALASRPRLLLLDEPLAGMGTEEAARMVELIASLKAETTVLLIEHDMDAVFSLADRITVLVEGRAIATGPVEAIRADPGVRRAYLGEDGAAETGAVARTEAGSC